MSEIVTLKPEDKAEAGVLVTHKSLDLSPENARFFRSEGDLISLELTHDDSTKEIFERVLIIRSFPISNPDEFLSVREPDTKKAGRGKEIGLVRRISDFDSETATLFAEELSLRYFSPEITKIHSVKEKFGYYYWDAETTSGNVSFVLNNPYSNIRVLENGSVYITDMDGNSFKLQDPKALDKASYKKLDAYL